MIPSKRSWLALLIVAGMLLSSVAPVFAQDDEPLPDPTLPEGSSLLFLPAMRNDPVTKLTVPAENMTSSARGTIQRAVPASVSALKLSEPLQLEGGIGELKLAPSLRQAQGKVRVVVQMAAPSLVEFQAASGMSASADMAAAAVSAVEAQQAQVVASAQSLDSSVTVLGSVHKVLNAVMLEIDAAAVKQLAADPSVRSVRPVINYERDLAETVPYIGAKAVQDLGFDGTGVKVAVLDSGIDYTHAAFGGPGTLEAYELAYGIAITDTRNTTRDGLFPTAKVVEGIDFVGEAWPNGPLAIDEDPIDFEGHGTHVGDIIGGAGGVAPGVDLYAVKVCSAVSSSCSGVALIQGMDYVVDPNGDDDTSDRMDIVNMSLGSSYGMVFDDDLSQAVEAATLAGVLTVAAFRIVGSADRSALLQAACHPDPVADRHCRHDLRHIPDLLGAVHKRDRRAAAVWRRRWRQPAGVHELPGRLAHGQNPAGQPWQLCDQHQGVQRRSRWCNRRHRGADCPGRSFTVQLWRRQPRGARLRHQSGRCQPPPRRAGRRRHPAARSRGAGVAGPACRRLVLARPDHADAHHQA
jgi:hypothetical protein